ncbi:MAG: small subunit ribosomal protein S8 [Microgenomates group bacterium LiPW_16]|nr:MAG: small subunit ribosomal protein S8 [Microgenomates group bacterium LiPW_16]
MLSDPIADFLARIKNGYLARKKEMTVPYSKLKENLAKILVEEGYLKEGKRQKAKGKSEDELILTLKYEGKKPALTDVQRVSKPGLRIYVGKRKIPKVLGGLGIVIVSTSKGLMTDEQARKKGLGGELVCKVW